MSSNEGWVVSAGAKGSSELPHTPDTRCERVAPPARASSAPMWLSVAALIISIAAAGWTLIHSPRERGIASYDFTSPEKALRSLLKIDERGDTKPRIELHLLFNGKRIAEKLRTLAVHKDSEYQGKKLLFVSFQENGIPKKDVVAFEKDAESGLWSLGFVSQYRMTDEGLQKAIQEWEAQTDGSK